VLNDEQHEWRQFDSQGRTVTYKNNLIYHTPTRKLNEIVTMTNSWSNGTASVTSATRRDELTGKEASLKPTEEELHYLFFYDPKIARPASENYKDFLNQKREWDLKKQFGDPDATTPTPLVPGAPVVPKEHGQVPTVPGAYAATPVSMAPAVPDPSFYVGFFGGPSLTGVNGLDADYSDFNAFAALLGKKNLPCASSTMMSGGVRVGTWGNWGIAPEWTKYLGFGVDFTYQKLDINTGMGSYTQTIHPFGITQTGAVNFSSNGYLATLGFMFYGRYGFLPDERISTFGTIQPFLGAGPVLSFASVEPKVTIDGDFVRQFGRQTSVFPGFGLETGVRYLPHRNIYLEASYRFFYGQPGFDAFRQENFNYKFNPDLTTHNFRFGLGFLF
jgi:opacity protein-like surface antigen